MFLLKTSPDSPSQVLVLETEVNKKQSVVDFHLFLRSENWIYKLIKEQNAECLDNLESMSKTHIQKEWLNQGYI